MKVFVLTVLAGLLAGCSQAYWTRPGASLPELALESDACYEAAVADETPAALPGPGERPLLLPRSTPPPRIWARAPRAAAFEHFDEQLRYERCMHARGWAPTRHTVPAR